MAEQPKVVQAGQICLNPNCEKHELFDGGNLVRYGKDKRGRQRLKCTCCGQVFSERKETIFYRKRTSEEVIVDVLTMIGQGSRIAAASRAMKKKPDTIGKWVKEAGSNAGSVENVLLKGCQAGASQVDGLWSYVKNKGKKSGHIETEKTGTFWRVTVLETETRLRVASSFNKNEQDATIEALHVLEQRNGMRSPPPLASDGHNGCGEAMKEIWGKVPQYKGIGPYPKHKAAGQDWQHLKTIKNRGQKEISVFCEKQVVYGDEEEVIALLGRGTVHLERTHLTMRNFNARIARKGPGMSKILEIHRAAATLEDAYYNLCHEVRTLKVPLFEPKEMDAAPRFTQRWKQRTPMMAAKITDHTWTVKELLLTIPISNPNQLLSG